jgi:protein gp37
MLKDVLTPEVLMSGKFWTHSRTLVKGCTKISPGCLNCWSEAMQMRFNGGKPFDGTIVEYWDRMLDILPKGNRTRKPRVWSYWNDVFHEGVSENFLTRLFNLIDVSQDYHIICTKRPERAFEYLQRQPGNSKAANLIIMVTMENQEMAWQRTPYAAQLAAMGVTVGALIEPMLGPVVFDRFILTETGPKLLFQWIICGPENSKGKRQFDGQWAMRLQSQASLAGVPFFYKAGLLNGKWYIEVPGL